MSYDVFLFDPEVAPRAESDFLAWYDSEMESEDYSVDPAILTPALSRWFLIVSRQFPALNGPTAPSEVINNPNAADYSFQPHSIAVAFSWDSSERASKAVFQAARDCGLGLYDPQGATTDIYRPERGNLIRTRASDRDTQGNWFTRIFAGKDRRKR